MPVSPDLAPWLTCNKTVGYDESYHHALVTEDLAYREALLPQLKLFVDQIHMQAKQHLRSFAGSSLDPFQLDTPKDPGYGYPEELPLTTKKGYFGEIMAGIYAEWNAPHGIDGWEVPTYPLILHEHAFNYLEKWRQTSISSSNVIGQSGDDCLAFHRDGSGRIIRCLVCEAKCSAKHDASLINDAHDNLSDLLSRPVSLMKLIAILDKRKDLVSMEWVDALRQFWMSEPRSNHERLDLAVYVCGKAPQRSNVWAVDIRSPSQHYNGGRRLEFVEIHLNDVDATLNALYVNNAS